MSYYYMTSLYRMLYPNTAYRRELKQRFETALEAYNANNSGENFAKLRDVAADIEEELEDWC